MQIVRFSYVFFCITQILIASMRTVERVKIGMYVSIIIFFVNASLNWILIFGHLGADARDAYYDLLCLGNRQPIISSA